MKLPGFLVISVMIHLVLLFVWPGFIGVTQPARVDVQQGLSVLEIRLPAVIQMKAPVPEPVPPEILTPLEPEPDVPPDMPEPVIAEEPTEPEAAIEPQPEARLPALGDEGALSPAAMKGLTRPKYPRMSRVRGEEGIVELIADINTKGRCDRVELIASSGFERLDQSALTWARRENYTPARRGDVFVDSRLKLRVPFELRRKGR